MKRAISRKTAMRRRTRGRFSGRLSNLKSKGSHRSFRIDPSFFTLVVESLAEYAVLTMDRDLTISSWNAASTNIFGYTEEEVIGTPVAALFVPEDRQKGYPEREFDEALAKGRVADERYHLAKGDRRFWTYGLAFPLKDEKGAVRGYVKIVRDESERKRKDDELLEKEERLRLAVEATGMATWDYRPDSESLHISEGGRAILAIAHDAKMTYGLFLSRFHAEDKENVDKGIRSCLTAKIAKCEVEARIVMPDGSERWTIIKAKALTTPCPDGRDSCPRIIGLIVDSTERKRIRLKAAGMAAELESRARKRAESLERAVKDRTEALEKTVTELESFSYTVSHDLRAPLRAIQGYASIVLERGQSCLDAESLSLLKRIESSSARMDRLVKDVLLFSEIGRERPAISSVKLDPIVAHIVENYDRVRDSRVTVKNPLGTVRGQETLLTQVVSNLIENAVKFVPEGKTPEVTVRSEHLKDGRLRLLIEDKGLGISQEYQQRIFQPFVRLASGEYAGTGIGLAIVKKAVDALGGQVGLSSEPGKGSTFWIDFPEVSDAS